MTLIQVFVVMNTLTESFEVTKWYDVSQGSRKRLENELSAISKKLYSKIVLKQRGNLPDMMIGIGSEVEETHPERKTSQRSYITRGMKVVVSILTNFPTSFQKRLLLKVT